MDYDISEYAWEEIYMFLTTIKGITLQKWRVTTNLYRRRLLRFLVIGEQFIKVLSIGQNWVFGGN
jgi:hypothetical protein